ncbi:hybrid sensor histidine kinase/response regulator [Ramlibacter sp. MAHUQ-53]|uniref:hybrid sensor histidine kinase/response regulator n=1 Tax=unclassified Ramlibacter TaxID=2617605 RepID=UPI003630BFD7
MSDPAAPPPPPTGPLPEGHYWQIVASAIDYAIVALTKDACVTSWNLGAQRITGWSEAEMLGQGVERLFLPEDREAGVPGRECALALKDGRAINERWHLRKDGSRFWASGEMMRLLGDDGQVRGFLKIVRDRTEQRQQALDLQFLARASEALAEITDVPSTLERIAHFSVPHFADYCSVDVLEADGQLRRVAFAHGDPTRRAQVVALHERLPPDPQTRGGTWHVLRTRQPVLVPRLTREVLAQAMPSTERREAVLALGLHSYIAAPLVAHGQALGVLSFATAESQRTYGEADLALAADLARRAAVALQNARLLRALQEADRAKDVFLATLAHELRNPLAPIRNGLSILLRVPGDRGRVEQVGSMIERQVGQLSRLVDDLLDVSRIATGKLELKKEPTSLLPVLATALEMSRPHIEAAHHQLVLSFTNEPTELLADPARLAQVFANLLNNAARYTRHGGRIEVAVEAQGEQLVVRVRDNGAGIEPAMLRRVFGMFTQVPQQDERRQGGLGIGLSLVDGLVRLHGGRVEARSEGPGRGSEFVVWLPRLARGPAPAREADAQAPPAAAPDAPATPAARRVLVVDDNIDAASTVADLLSMSGCEVDVVHDGEQAVEHARSFRPDVVLLDIGLPDISGYEAARRIRQLAGVRQPRLIALTGWGQAQDKRLAAEAGFDQHWTKPVEPQRLLDLAAAV